MTGAATIVDCRVPELRASVLALVRGHEALEREALFEVERVAEGYRLSWRGEPYWTAGTPGGLLGALEVALDHERQRLVESRCAFHAALVGPILVAGRSEAGKSTLATALVARGLAYATDDCAFVEEDGSVSPYPRRIGLRAGTLELVGDLGGRFERITYEPGNGLIADYLMPHEVATGPVRVSVVAFLERRGRELALRPIDAAEATARLLEHAVSPGSGRNLGRAASLVRGAATRLVIEGGLPCEIAAALSRRVADPVANPHPL